MNIQQKEQWVGIGNGAGAYLIWGFLPIYWKFLDEVPAGEVLAHRIIWSLALLLCVIFLSKKLRASRGEILEIFTDPKQLFAMFMATLFITGNWFTYIWAVSNNHIVDTSLGYYINPLVSVLLGVFVLKEKLSLWEVISFILAALGVISLLIYAGTFPWIAFVLAFCFGFYGLFKKIVKLGSMLSLTIETLLVTPFAILYLVYLYNNTPSSFSLDSLTTSLLLIGSGAATAVPLLLFGIGVKRISLSLIGFLQYIAPTIILFVGVVIYKEPFTLIHFISFLFIWLAVFIFSLARTPFFTKIETKLLKRKNAA